MLNLKASVWAWLGLLMLSGFASAEEVKFCVWDPVGANGPIMAELKDTEIKAITWGIHFKLVAYTDESVAANDFRAGICDAVFLSAMLAMDFVPVAGTLDAVGGTQSEEELKALLATLSTSKANALVSHNDYEIGAIYPVGSVYLFVNDRSKVRVSDLGGRRLSILNGDVAFIKMAELVGAAQVPTTLTTSPGMFNNGNLDVYGAVALSYDTFELYNGLGTQGGVIDYRIQYALMNAVIRRSKFPPEFGAKMRTDSFNRFSELQKMVEEAEKNIPGKHWIHLDKAARNEYDQLMHDIRVSLGKEGLYDNRALKLQWKIRCKFNPTRAECAQFE